MNQWRKLHGKHRDWCTIGTLDFWRWFVECTWYIVWTYCSEIEALCDVWKGEVFAKFQRCSVTVNGGWLLTIDAKCVLRMSEEKCLNAVEDFGVVMPIKRSSCHRSLLDFSLVTLVSRYLHLAVSWELETNEWRCLYSFMSSGQCERDALMNARSRSFIAFKIACITHGFIL